MHTSEVTSKDSTIQVRDFVIILVILPGWTRAYLVILEVDLVFLLVLRRVQRELWASTEEPLNCTSLLTLIWLEGLFGRCRSASRTNTRVVAGS